MIRAAPTPAKRGSILIRQYWETKTAAENAKDTKASLRTASLPSRF
jgi:hypothetical protein